MRKILSRFIDQLLNTYYRLRWKWLSRKFDPETKAQVERVAKMWWEWKDQKD
jgi:hypothetical protein